MKKLILSAFFGFISVSLYAHANPVLTAKQVDGKTMRVCDALAISINETAQLTLTASVTGDNKTQSSMQNINDGLIMDFTQLGCEGRIEARAKDCREINVRFERAKDEMLAHLGDARSDSALGRMEKAQDDYARRGCARVLK